MKILIIRFSSIGDIVLTSAVVRCLYQQIPNAEIHYLTKKQFAPLFQYNPYLKKVWEYSKELTDTINALKSENFDWIIDLHNNLRSKRFCWYLKIKVLAFNTYRWQRFLWIKFRIPFKPYLHIVERFFLPLAKINVLYDNQGLDFFYPQDTPIPNLPNHYLVWVIGASYTTKQLPSSKVIEGLNNILAPVVLLGGKEDIQLATQIIDNTLHQNVINLVGKTTLIESAKIIDMSQCIISLDTGMQHIAAALKKKIFAIWGATNPTLGYTPFLPKIFPENLHVTNFQVESITCSPCHQHGTLKCPQKHFKCMLNQNINALYNQVNNWLNY